MTTLSTTLRRQLESACKQARTAAEKGARKALEALGVPESDSYRFMDEKQKDLRRKLRAQARQLGDAESRTKPGAYEIKHLVEKLAYDQWHRLLFARFLLENNLLISPQHGVSVSLDDCEELAPSLGLKDAWAVAARFAAKELPQIFRDDDPAGAVELATEDRNPLIQLVTGLPVEVFTAGDSLGWSYQFWQAERKDEVNAAGNRIGADELPAVTQLFTEDYMVDFLLDNTLGAWHAEKVLAAQTAGAENMTEPELRQIVALPGAPWKYLRFVRAEDGKWSPAAGTFAGWPRNAKELTCLDPCMGSGHFIVAMFERLVALRMADEALDETAAIAGVIQDNLFGLEIDPRCTQIAAFNVALAAWKRIGHCALPVMNLACSGLAPNAKLEDWLKLAGDNRKIQNGMDRLYQIFRDAPLLGSLINPRLSANNLYVADYHELQPLLEKALAQETQDDRAHEMAVTARGLAKAAEFLAKEFTLVATNVPYLGRGKQDEALKEYCDRNHSEARSDLATCFVERSLAFSQRSGTCALVTPQNWLSLGDYSGFRKTLLNRKRLVIVAQLGPGAFQMIGGHVVKASLVILENTVPEKDAVFAAISTADEETPKHKQLALEGASFARLSQTKQLTNPEARILVKDLASGTSLGDFVTMHEGSSRGDLERYDRCFWELHNVDQANWSPLLNSPISCKEFAGRETLIFWQGGKGSLSESEGARIRGMQAWNRDGVFVARTSNLKCTLSSGEIHAQNGAVLIPKTPANLPAVWTFCSSESFCASVREFDQKIIVASGALLAARFDLTHWQEVAAQKYPNGLPTPYSSDPTQWLFNGHPKGSDQPLQVAVARLLGYEWPRQTGSSFPNCPPLDPDGLTKLADADGIVCLSATKGEAPAAERLREFLNRAWGKNWNGTVVDELLAGAGYAGKTLDDWLRDAFFEQHCSLFHHRPFIWHIWDGHKSGFSALVNYHQLTHANLEKLTYAYLGDWIRRQQASNDAGEAGSDARLQAAKQLQAKLKLILEGEPPYDIFVRWKPLAKQATGWHPDLNDGVRMNIRPFATADILRKRVKIKWDKDRGKEPFREKAEFPWFWNWDEKTQDFAGVGKEPDGNRWNDCHYRNDLKRKARKE